MDLMEIRRRMLIGQKIPEQWDYVYVKKYANQSWFLDVVEGQVLTVKWESPQDNVNLNGWVLNGNGCCENIRQIRDVGKYGERELEVTASGQVRVGAYSTSSTFALSVGSIVYIKIN